MIVKTSRRFVVSSNDYAGDSTNIDSRSPNGWLNRLGAKDNAGCGVVHLVGGWASLVATTYLGPRTGIKGGEILFLES